MDQRPTEEDRKRELSTRLAASRLRIATGRDRLQDSLHPVRRLRAAVRRKPVQAFALAAGAAFTVSLLRRRGDKRRRRTGLTGLLIKGGVRLAKPAIRVWLLKLAKEHFLDPYTPKAPDIHGNSP